VAAFRGLLHKREAKQVFERHQHRLFFKGAFAFVLIGLVFHALIAGAQNFDPAAHKAGFLLQLRGKAGAHVMAPRRAAAIGMAQHNDMGHFQRSDRIFNGGRRAVMVDVRPIGGHQVGDVAMDEELALLGPENRGHMHPAITTRDHHGAGVLALFREVAIPRLVLGIGRCLPTMITLNQIVGPNATCESLVIACVR